jgi:hypothetical protein
MTTATAAPVPGPAPDRDWWVLTGMAVAATSATLASFSGLQGLAILAGWPPRLAWLLPVTLDAYAMTAARVWLAATTRTQAARRFARANALGAIAASIAGNATYHATSTGLLHLTWPVVVTVGAVPAAILGLTAHLHALQGRTGDEDEPSTPTGTLNGTTETRPEPDSEPAEPGLQPDLQSGADSEPEPRASTKPGTTRRRPRPRTEEALLAAAQRADARYRATHAGRAITRDELRKSLRVSGARAGELRRQLVSEDRPDDQPAEEP